MSHIDSSRVFEISELPARADVNGDDKTLVSRAGHSAPVLLSVLYNWVKSSLTDYYQKLPWQLPPANTTLDNDDRTVLSRGDGLAGSGYLRMGDLFTWVKDKTDLLYSKLPAITSKGGQVLMVAPDSASFLWSGDTSTPAITVGAGAGATGTVSISGTARSGQISVTVAGSLASAASANIATVAFGATLASAPRVLITPANELTARLAVASIPWASSSTTNFLLKSNSTAVPVGVYKWSYLIDA